MRRTVAFSETDLTLTCLPSYLTATDETVAAPPVYRTVAIVRRERATAATRRLRRPPPDDHIEMVHDHVHRPLGGRLVHGGREPRPYRAAGVRGRTHRTGAPHGTVHGPHGTVHGPERWHHRQGTTVPVVPSRSGGGHHDADGPRRRPCPWVRRTPSRPPDQVPGVPFGGVTGTGFFTLFSTQTNICLPLPNTGTNFFCCTWM